MNRFAYTTALVLAATGTFASGASAQGMPLMPYQEHEKRLRASQSTEPLKSDLFGENISLYNGSTEFSVVDIEIPGNNALPVRLGRQFKIESKKELDPLGGFGAWDIDVPYISGTFTTAYGWNVGGNGATNRCSQFWYPKVVGVFDLNEIWSGTHLHIPGEGDSEVVHLSGATYTRPDANYQWGTKTGYRLSCMQATGFSGEGFVAVDTNGTKYTFDVGIVRDAGRIRKAGEHAARSKIHLMARRVEDRHGNWVNYNYAGGGLQSITSSDGRTIELFYNGDNKIDRARANGRDWLYEYGPGMSYHPTATALTRVTRPDLSEWRYAYTGNLSPMQPLWDVESDGNCTEPPQAYESFTLNITHPSGAVGAFETAYTRGHRSGTPENACVVISQGLYALVLPDYYENYALFHKTITGAGLAPTQWTYNYGDIGYGRTTLPYPCMSCTLSKTVQVSQPDGSRIDYEFGVLFEYNDGRLLSTTTRDASLVARRVQTDTYTSDAEASGLPFPNTYGLFAGTDDQSSNRIRPVRTRTTQQDGVTFQWQVDSGCTAPGKPCFDHLARSTRVTKSSTATGNPTRTDITAYYDDLSKWALGQVASVTNTNTGLVEAQTDYLPATALPQRTYAFGKLQQSLEYYADGTLFSVSDGRDSPAFDTSIRLYNWKRGVPQVIGYPATAEHGQTSASAIVDDNGWITAVTDENGYSTGYGYDAMGRLASIVYPTDDSTVWNTTTQTFAPSANPVYGLPAGHWRQTVNTGNARSITYFDAMWRPVIKETYDATNSATTTATLAQTITRYDASGRPSFVSYPQRTLVPAVIDTWANPVVPPNALGMRTEYDALDRVTATRQDAENGTVLSTTTEYLPGFQTKAKSARGQTTGAATITAYMAYDQPTMEMPVAITHPAGAYTNIFRDVFGKPLHTVRTGTGGLWNGRYYTYDAHQRLCKQSDLETGTSVFGYDTAGNLTTSAAGLSWSVDANCALDTSGRLVTRTYDARNRLKTLTFPTAQGSSHANGDQSWAYTKDNLPEQISTWNIPAAGLEAKETRNLYAYNARRLLTTETLAVPAWYTYQIGYEYDANASLKKQFYPSGRSVDFVPNALGQPTQAKDLAPGGLTYASGVSYYPNGAIQQFTYGNGIVHSMTQNARQLPAWVESSGGVLKLGSAYDANGNVHSVEDQATAGHQSRLMEYDDLDRLTKATSTMFGADSVAVYAYDALDNLTRTKVAGRDTYYCYNGQQRLDFVRSGSDCAASPATTTLSYDLQGNLAGKNAATYQFDHGNRLREVTTGGTALERYRYDAHGRRVLASRLSGPADTIGVIFSQYANNGQLLFQENLRSAVNKDIDSIYLAGSLLAQREVSLAGGAVTVKYQHTDALGSPVAVTGSTGAVLERMDYEPYGKGIYGGPGTTAPKDGPGYTGHVLDLATGMNYMQQRYCDPTLGRFLSVDPVAARPIGDNFNRYWYANNNPYKFTDPDGREAGGGYATGLYTQSGPITSSTETANAGLAMGAAVYGGPIVRSLIGGIRTLGSMIRGGSDKPKVEEKTRAAPGADGGRSTISVERDPKTGEALSKTHTVKTDGKTVHQHQDHFGKSGGTKTFSDALTGTKTVGEGKQTPTPKDTPPSFPREPAKGSRY